MPGRVVVNGRFVGRRLTGVERVAAETLKNLTGVELQLPPARARAGIPGKAWENLVLPLKAKDAVLWSPCNTGPLVHPNHVVTVHDLAPFDVPETFTGRYAVAARFTTRRLAERASLIVTPSQYTAERVHQHLDVPNDKLRVVPWSVQHVATSVHARRPLIVTIGSLQPRKGLSGLIEAYESARAASALSGWSLAVVGDENQTVFARANLRRDVPETFFTGRLRDQDLWTLLGQASVFISNSAYEGFGLTPLEAHAAGCRLIVTDIPAHREVVGSLPNVAFVPVGDINALSAALVAEAEAGVWGAPPVLARRTWSEVAREYAAIFDEARVSAP